MLEIVRKNLEKRGFEALIFRKAAQAAEFLAEYARGKSVGIGGCMSAKQMGLYEALTQNGCKVYWHWIEPGRETFENARKADIYISSANALALSGEIVNIDGSGNRIASTVFGPKETIFIIGSNKIAQDLDGAIKRARNVATKLNAKRLGLQLRCGENECTECAFEKCICAATLILHKCPGLVKCKVLLIDEPLGY